MAYNVTIDFASKELSGKDKVMLKDLTNATPLERCVDGADSFVIRPDFYALLSVHNDKAKNNTDYKVCIIMDVQGNKFKTGSESFISAFTSIMEDMADCDEAWELSVYGLPSKNYAGKNFLTCSVI